MSAFLYLQMESSNSFYQDKEERWILSSFLYYHLRDKYQFTHQPARFNEIMSMGRFA